MGFEAKKTEHCGPKRGNGAYWGYRWDAKKESNRIRRENAKRDVRDAVRMPATTQALKNQPAPNSATQVPLGNLNRDTRCFGSGLGNSLIFRRTDLGLRPAARLRPSARPTLQG